LNLQDAIGYISPILRLCRRGATELYEGDMLQWHIERSLLRTVEGYSTTFECPERLEAQLPVRIRNGFALFLCPMSWCSGNRVADCTDGTFSWSSSLEANAERVRSSRPR